MLENNKIQINKITFQPTDNNTKNRQPITTNNFNSKLTSFQTLELVKLFKDSYGITLTVTNTIKNQVDIKNIFANLTGSKNIIITENILARMLQNSAYMQQIISKVIAYFNLKSAEINTLATGVRPLTSGVVLFPDGTIGFWPFSFKDVESFVALQKSKKEEERQQAHLKRIKELSKKRHRQIRNKNWQAAYEDVQNKPLDEKRLIDQLLKPDD